MGHTLANETDLRNYDWIGQTLIFHLQSRNLESPCADYMITTAPQESTMLSFERSQKKKASPPLKQNLKTPFPFDNIKQHQKKN